MIEDKLEEALLDRTGPRVEFWPAVALDAIRDIQSDVTAAVERRQDLQSTKHQDESTHREPPIIVGRGMKGLRPRRRNEGETAGLQQVLDVARRPHRRARMLEHVTADHQD